MITKRLQSKFCAWKSLVDLCYEDESVVGGEKCLIADALVGFLVHISICPEKGRLIEIKRGYSEHYMWEPYEELDAYQDGCRYRNIPYKYSPISIRGDKHYHCKIPQHMREGSFSFYIDSDEVSEYGLIDVFCLSLHEIWLRRYAIPKARGIDKITGGWESVPELMGAISKENELARKKVYNSVRGSAGRIYRYAGKKKDCRSLDILGCSIEYAKQFLADKFSEGMSWNNHGEWHIDHIIPLSSAGNNLKLLKNLGHYTNLQPLWAHDNLSKNAKLNWSLA